MDGQEIEKLVDALEVGPLGLEATVEVLSMAAAAEAWLRSKYPDAIAADAVALTGLNTARRNQDARATVTRERLETKRAKS